MTSYYPEVPGSSLRLYVHTCNRPPVFSILAVFLMHKLFIYAVYLIMAINWAIIDSNRRHKVTRE